MDKGKITFLGDYSSFERENELLLKIQETQEKNALIDENFKIWSQCSEGKADDEEMEEKLKISSIWTYLMGGFSNVFLLIFGFLIICVVQYLSQMLLYWTSHRQDLPDKSDEYFLTGLGYWTLGVYLSLICSSVYTLSFVTRCNQVLHDNSLKSLSLTFSSFFDRNSSGRIINRFSKDVSNSDGPLSYFIFDSTTTVGVLVSSIIVQIYSIPLITIVIPFYLIIQLYIFCKVSVIVAKLRKKENLSKGPILSSLNSIIEGLVTIRSQKIQETFIKLMESQTNYFYRCYITYNSFLRCSQLYSDLAGLIVIMVNVILIIKSDNLIDASLSAYSLAASMNIVSISTAASKDLLELSSLFFSAQNLIEYQKLLPESIKTEKPFKITEGKIEFKDLSMKYQSNLPPALKGISFIINPMSKVGIVGRTGSGKSSILTVLCRLVEPFSGTVMIDGQDYLTSGLHDLRSQISIIPQSAVLFSSSLRDNLDPILRFSDDEIWSVLKLVGLESLGNDEHVLERPVGGLGIQFSEGQKQLLTIARAILTGNKIVLVDEATSNVDLKTDQIIQKVMKKRFRDATFIVIAHRILTVAKCDLVIVMSDGKCVEFDSPFKLFQDKGSEFFKLCSCSGILSDAFQSFDR